MKLLRKRGDTSNILQVFIQDSSSSTGAGLTGLVFNSSGLTAYYHKDTDTTATAITLVTMTVGTFTSSGFKEIDATNMPGWYQFCPPDAALSASGTPHSVGFHLKGATNMAPLAIEVQLIAADVEDTVRLGLTALPNAAAEAAGGLYTRGAGAGQIAQSNNGRVDTDVKSIANAAIAAATFAANALDAVWSTAARVLTAGTNIVLAKGVGVTGFNDLDAAGVRGAVGLAAANLDTQLAAIGVKTTNLPASPAATGDAMTLTAGERTSVADALLNRDMSLGSDTGSTTVRTVRQALRFLRNKWTMAGGTLTVFKEDDSAPMNGTPIIGASGNVAAGAAVATLAAAAGKRTFISGFALTGAGATAASIVSATVAGLLGGTLTFNYVVVAGATLKNGDGHVTFQPAAAGERRQHRDRGHAARRSAPATPTRPPTPGASSSTGRSTDARNLCDAQRPPGAQRAAAPLNVPHGSAAYVISDEMPAAKHMATGKVITSKAAFRAHTRAAGCVEVGTDPAVARPGRSVAPPPMETYVHRALHQLENGYDPRRG
jgi:hypothetical protein